MSIPHPVITLTSDFGLDDPYVGVMKGVILRISPECRLVDLAHSIGQGDVVKASLAIRAAIPYFPAGTVHLVVVDPGVGSARLPIAVHARGMHFVGPDNGLFWFLADDDPPPRIVEIRLGPFVLPRTSSTFHGRDIFAPAAAHLASGVRLDALGTALKSMVGLALPKATRTGAYQAEGTVIYVDHFGNCVSNVAPEELGLELGKGVWTVRCDAGVFPVGRYYSEVARGASIAVVGSSGHLELSIRDDSASQRLGLGVGTSFLLERIEP